MAEEKITSRIEIGSEFGEQVMSEIGSLREELVTIRQLLERGHSIDRAIEEYRSLPLNVKNPIRWGFLGAWGKGGSNAVTHVHTTTMDDFFNDPDASDENVATLAAVFANPNTIKICRYLFCDRETAENTREYSQEELKKGCNLSDEELDAAVKPLLEWRFVAWKDGILERSGPDLNGQGVNYAVTLIGMTKTAFAYKERQEHK